MFRTQSSSRRFAPFRARCTRGEPNAIAPLFIVLAVFKRTIRRSYLRGDCCAACTSSDRLADTRLCRLGHDWHCSIQWHAGFRIRPCRLCCPRPRVICNASLTWRAPVNKRADLGRSSLNFVNSCQISRFNIFFLHCGDNDSTWMSFLQERFRGFCHFCRCQDCGSVIFERFLTGQCQLDISSFLLQGQNPDCASVLNRV